MPCNGPVAKISYGISFRSKFSLVHERKEHQYQLVLSHVVSISEHDRIFKAIHILKIQ